MPVKFEDTDAIQRILTQLPPNIKEDDVRRMYNECNGNEFETVCRMLNVATKSETKIEKSPSATQKMWNDIREICDSHDSAIYSIINKST